MSNQNKLNSKARIIYIANYKILDISWDLERNLSSFENRRDIFTISFPVILKSSGEVWELASLYFNSYLIKYNDIVGDNLKSIAVDLLHYYRFIEDRELDELYFPKLLNKRITYLFRRHLIEQIEKGDMSLNTAKQRINRVVNFYESCLENGYLNSSLFENQPYQLIKKIITINGKLGFEFNKEIVSSSLSIKKPYSVKDSTAIYDGGKLRPLINEEQEILSEYLDRYGSRTLQLMCSIAFHSGARLQSICTIKVKNINDLITKDKITSNKTYTLRIGAGSGIDSKGDIPYILELPKWLVERLHEYINSDTWKERARKSYYKDSDENYIFLTRIGSPFYTSKSNMNDIKDSILKENKRIDIQIYKGNAVRKNFDDLVKKIQEDYPWFGNIRFHDLRATFGMNIVINLQSRGINNQKCVDYIRKRMGHKNIQTTWSYLDHKEILAKNIDTQNIFENNLFNFL
ncbi:hypothetical protein AV645_12860 [Acinetobacter calcoaceticus]|uniref:site-specific integrase n=1 Tax=Acinetobacter calcoaceticus TaxID=471 RepID=UPI00074B0C79|nr:site-specific integrase [Acinetobacter calcoaceticus]KUM13746.1 hypothetical protein AV645_12860 [Acinetobacter calcoaceticus]